MTDEKLDANMAERIEIARALEVSLVATSLYLEEKILPPTWSLFLLAFENDTNTANNETIMLQMVTSALTASQLVKLRGALDQAKERIALLEKAIVEKKAIPVYTMEMGELGEQDAPSVTKH